jgi:prophage regulatory protein
MLSPTDSPFRRTDHAIQLPELAFTKMRQNMEKHYRRPAVEEITGLSRSTLYLMMETGDFPRPIRIGKRAVAWPESAIATWLGSRPNSTGDAG